MSRSYRDRGVVLRTQRLGEADRIVTLLLEGRGLTRASAKGVRRPGSRIGARLEPFAVVDVELHRGRTFEVVRQVETVEANAGIRADDRLWAAASVLAEVVLHVAVEGERDHELQRLLRAGLAALATAPEDPSVFVDAFLLRASSIVGFPVRTTVCARCAAPGPHEHLSVVGGGTLCDGCAAESTQRVGPGVVAAVRTLAEDGAWQTLPALAREAGPDRVRAGSYARAYAEHHLDRRLRSYDLVERPDPQADGGSGRGAVDE